jgi:hypothetical protein
VWGLCFATITPPLRHVKPTLSQSVPPSPRNVPQTHGHPTDTRRWTNVNIDRRGWNIGTPVVRALSTGAASVSEWVG